MKKYIVLLIVAIAVIITAVVWETKETEKTMFVMDTVSSIHVKGNHKNAVKKAFARVKEIEDRMSSHTETSDISTEILNKDTAYVIYKGLEYGDISEGVFDISVKPVCDLWNITGDNPKVPSEEELSDALALVDYRRVEISGDRLILPDGMDIELGGIAKGYAADEACKILRDDGVDDGLVDLGGNIVAIGTKTIGVRNPLSENNGDYFGTLKITDCAVATSGGYERYFEHNGIKYHHIFDPRTGYPAKTDILSATVVADKAIDADCWSTILFSAGFEKAKEYITKYELNAVLMDKNNNVYVFGNVDFISSDVKVFK